MDSGDVVSVFSSVANVFVAVAVGSATVYTMIWQLRTSQAQLRVDLYKERHLVYLAAKEIVATMYLQRKLSDGRLAKYMSDVHCSKWIFDKELWGILYEYVPNLATDCQKCFYFDKKCDKCSCSRGSPEAIRKEVVDFYWKIDSLFDKHMVVDLLTPSVLREIKFALDWCKDKWKMLWNRMRH